jgi:site-specific recombinase XerD
VGKCGFLPSSPSVASHFVQKGVSLNIVSKLLGHSDVKTTEIYAHLAPQRFRDVVRSLDEREMGIELEARR